MEYSANLDRDLDISALFTHLSAAALETGIFPLGGIRLRAHRCTDYRIGDGAPENGFIHLTVKIGAGRSDRVLKKAADTIFAALLSKVDPIFDNRPLSVGFEMSELHPVLNYKKNNIHEILKRKNQS